MHIENKLLTELWKAFSESFTAHSALQKSLHTLSFKALYKSLFWGMLPQFLQSTYFNISCVFQKCSNSAAAVSGFPTHLTEGAGRGRVSMCCYLEWMEIRSCYTRLLSRRPQSLEIQQSGCKERHVANTGKWVTHQTRMIQTDPNRKIFRGLIKLSWYWYISLFYCANLSRIQSENVSQKLHATWLIRTKLSSQMLALDEAMPKRTTTAWTYFQRKAGQKNTQQLLLV